MIEAIMIGMLAGNPNFDNSVPLSNFLQNCQEDCVVHIPKGQWYFNTPMPSITQTVAIIGDGTNSTVLYKNYVSATSFFSFIAGTGSRMEHVTLGALMGKSGTALELRSQAGVNGGHGLSPDFFYGNNINVTVYNGAQWGIGIDLRGVYRARQPLSGLRDLKLDNLFVFGCNQASLNINTVHGAKISGQFFQAGGTTNAVKFNAWHDDKNTGIILESPILGPLQLWNTTQSMILTYSITSINKINSTVKIP